MISFIRKLLGRYSKAEMDLVLAKLEEARKNDYRDPETGRFVKAKPRAKTKK